MMNTDELHSLNIFFKQAKYIWEKNEEIKKLTNERFNIFSVLRKDHDEEKLHSVFLAELLSPKGSHGLSTQFLTLFIEIVNQKYAGEFSFDASDAKVICEKHVGENGRIDIYVKSGKQLLLIENKIYAGDQNRQLIRYHNHMEGNDGSVLLYLTLDGHSPSKDSKGELKEGEDFYCISYKADILPWLESCLKEAVEVPAVRETIKQYINLIKKLTGGLMNQQLEKEITEIIKENIEIARVIKNNFDKAQRELLSRPLEEFIKDSDYSDIKKVWNQKAWHFKSRNGVHVVVGLREDDGKYYLFAFPDFNEPKKYPIYGYDMSLLKPKINAFSNDSGDSWRARTEYPINCEELNRIIEEWDAEWVEGDCGGS
jgi:hypothetical protein